MRVKVKYLVIILMSFPLYLISQNLYQKGDTLNVKLDGYKFGGIQWQLSYDDNNWMDIVNKNDTVLEIVVENTASYRAIVKKCEDTYYSDVTKVNAPQSDAQYADFVGSYLASDKLAGRSPGTQGDSLAVFFISELFQKSNLKPLQSDRYYIPFLTNKNVPTFNVIGVLPGNDVNLKKEAIVITGHYDHLGVINNLIFNGADDNASGTAGVCLLARKLKDINSKRTIIFVAAGAEEKGCLGTTHLHQSKEFNLYDVKYVFNLDMIGKLRSDSLYFYNINSSQNIIFPYLKNFNTDNLNLAFSNDMYFPGSWSDHVVYSRTNNSVAAYGITTGKHFDYHKPTDDWDKINVRGLVKVTDFIYRIVEDLANKEKLP